ncbi:glutamate--cysteine ligase catalytic subunit-like [Stylophora pistillata]|uniref:glutamate--cysteine ligase catalytic subunit-like n=1 Tax=Stylophora pistillata TaxID=50429 RepID=UPI000C03EA38|nr:glutamate--cysteine ligase catalytic subunit-like [Stylophora pistillata]
MGLLSEGCPLSWSETKQYRGEVRKHGVLQFLHIYNREKDRDHDGLKWRDEMEYTLLKFDHENEKVYCNLKAKDVLDDLSLVELTASPGQPMGESLAYFNIIELNMRLRNRREEMKRFLNQPGEAVQSIVAFPRLGCPNFTFPIFEPTPTKELSYSMFIPDQAVCQNQLRFSLKRKVTLQSCNITEARFLYDQLAVVSPILMALSAGTPIARGYLSDVDCRWGIISESTDDRTPEERGLEPLKENRYVIPKSRYDSVSTYLSAEGNGYNDIDLVYDEDIYQQLVVAGVDEPLARHVAHLFIGDPVASLCLEDLYKDDEESSDLFENINSTNWQTVRFKPPQPNSSMGWRVEFRSLDIQLTDLENAAFVTFVILLTRVILSFDLNLLIPISKVDENMVKAQKRDAVRQGEFSFRRNLCKSVAVKEAENCPNGDLRHDGEFELMSIDKIINGKGEAKAPELFGEFTTPRIGDAIFKKYLEMKRKIKNFEDDSTIGMTA